MPRKGQKASPKARAGLALGPAAAKAAREARAAAKAAGDPEEAVRQSLLAKLPPGEPSHDELTAIRFAAMTEVNLNKQRELRDRPGVGPNEAWRRTEEIQKSLPMVAGFYRALSEATERRLKAERAPKPVVPSLDPERGVKVVRLLCKQAALPGVSPRVAKLGRELVLALEEDDQAKERAALEEAALK